MIVTDEEGNKFELTEIKGLGVTMDQASNNIMEAFSPKKKSIWELEKGDKFYAPFEDHDGEKCSERYYEDWHDKHLVESGDVFFTHEEALQELNKRKALQRIKKYIWEKGFEFEPDWSDARQTKCWIRHAFPSKHQESGFETMNHNYIKSLSEIGYLSCFEHAQDVIDNCSTDLKILFDITD